MADADGKGIIIIEGDFTKHVKKHWDKLGMTPIILKLLVEGPIGWPPDMIDDAFRSLVGPDYADINMTEWMVRLEKAGYTFPDGKPVIRILREILVEIYDVTEETNN
jgi:hypothetical protein